jgi:hypothetical protein
MFCTSFTFDYLFFSRLNIRLQLFNATVMWSETPMVSSMTIAGEVGKSATAS